MDASVARPARRPLIVVAFLLLTASLTAPGPLAALDYGVFSSWGVADGLPSAEVRDMYPDRFGILWIATAEGLVRWDGDVFEVINEYTTPRVNDAAVTRIREMPDGSIWVGDDGGITVFDPGTDATRRYAVDGSGSGGIPFGAITDFAPEASGDVWIASWGGGLLRWDAAQDRIEREYGPDWGVNSVHVAADGTVVFADRRRGLFRRTTGAVTEKLLDGLSVAPAGITPLSDGRIVVSADSGSAFICADDGSDCSAVALEADLAFVPRAAMERPDGDILLAGTGGLYSLEEAQRVLRDGAISRCRLPHDVLLRIVPGRGGRIWIGTRGGLALYDPAANLFQDHDAPGLSLCEQGPGDTYVESLAAGSDGAIWVGGQTTEPFLYRVRGETVSVPLDVSGLESSVVTLHELPDGRLAIGTYGDGLWIGDPVTGELERVEQLEDGVVRDVEAATDGGMWLGVDGSVVRIGPGRGALRVFALPDAIKRRVADVDLLPDGRIAVASWTGEIGFLDPGSGEIVISAVPDTNSIISITAAGDGTLWLGSFGDGLLHVTSEGEVLRHLTAADGLPSELVMGTLIGSDGLVRAATRGGLVQLNREGEPDRIYTAADGLIDTYVGRDAFMMDENGRIWLGSTSGVASIQPDTRQDRVPLAEPRIGRLSIDGQRVLPGDPRMGGVPAALTTVRLNPEDATVGVRLRVPGVWDHSGLRFSYRLTGLTDQWTQLPQGSNDLAYSNLRPGRYRLELRAGGMRWRDSPVSGVDVVVAPRWYERGFVRALGLAGIAAVVVLLVLLRDRAVQWRTRQLERVVAERTEEIRVERDRYSELSNQLEKLVQERTADLQDAVTDRETLLRELHHRVKNNMQIISSLLSLSERPDADLHEAIHQSQMRIQAMAMIHESLYRQKGQLATVDFSGYLNQLAHSILSMHAGPTIRLTCDLPQQSVPISIETAVPLGMVVSEVLTNCFKHAFRGRAGGTIAVRLWVDRDGCHVEVEDDGVGVDPESIAADSVGMLVVRNLSEQIGASGTFASGFTAEGGGTRFTVTVPAAPAPV